MSPLELATGIDPSLLALVEPLTESTPFATTIGVAVAVLLAAGTALIGASRLWHKTTSDVSTIKTAVEDLAEAQDQAVDDHKTELAKRDKTIGDLETRLAAIREEQRTWQQQTFQPLHHAVIRLEEAAKHRDRPRSRSHQKSQPG